MSHGCSIKTLKCLSIDLFFYRNFSLFVIFGDNYFKPLLKLQALGFTDYLASAGCFMGLIAGISVMSLIEFFYHIVLQVPKDRSKVQPYGRTRHQKKFFLVNQDHALYKFTKYLSEFLHSSSIHGAYYLTKENRSKGGKIFWAVYILVSLVLCSLFISDSIRNSETNPFVLTIDDKFWKVEDVNLFCNDKYIVTLLPISGRSLFHQ